MERRTRTKSSKPKKDSVIEDDNHMTFYFIRHGQNEGNKAKILQGHSDGKLTKLGQNQVNLY